MCHTYIWTIKAHRSHREFFNDEGKEFILNNDGSLIIKSGDKKILPKQLSSGEKQLFLIFLKAVNSSDKPTLFFLDEPEVSMHLSWQERLLNALKSISPNIQVIAVSHSPALVMKGWLHSLSQMDEITINSKG